MRRWLEPTDEPRRRAEITRRRLLQAALASTAALAAACGSDTDQRDATAHVRAKSVVLPPGTRPDPTRPEGAESMPQIEHIVIYMNENHSFDSYYGMLGRGDGYTRAKGGRPLNANPGPTGKPVSVFHQDSVCTPVTGDHSWKGQHLSWNHGKMDGFIRANGGHTGIMGYYDGREIPFYYSLADVFPICDRWFSSVMGPTHPNRRYLQAATSAGMTITTAAYALKHPTAPNGTIWDRLDAHGITWKDYMVAGVGDIFLWTGPTTLGKFLARTASNRATSPTGFLADCRNGTLPQVSIIAPGVSTQYDEGSQDIQNGEAYSYSIINAVMDSPLWEKTVLFFLYDECGGCYDHVPPPPALAPDNIAPVLSPGTPPGTFAQYGMRVPAFVISPYARKDYVSHVVHDHTSILKFIETKYNLGAMTYRDANADNLLDTLDFASASHREPPTLPRPGQAQLNEALPANFARPVRFAQPGLPAGGSTCEPQPRPGVNPIPADAVPYRSLAQR